ncbi:NUDIX hydrolase [Yoonia sp.]|uniref:NUDIX hydrolase n=1 Tax=Yoonia sp. TaxID=2212373 RepID=UPI0025F3C6C4|nr:NUDIX hydrolase [Yoonia sp.]
MTSVFHTFWTDALRPLLQRPPVLQVAALCHRAGPDGLEVLLVTSSRGRWILPKGWPIDGLTAAEAAMQEAWEEAGVRAGTVADTALGSFRSDKQFDNGAVVPCETQVFAIAVTEVVDDYPEADRRDRIWVSRAQAAAMVDEPGLKPLLAGFNPR